MNAVSAEIDKHRELGRFISVDGHSAFARDQGEGPPVVCLHGVPVSSYVYRLVQEELSARHLRSVAIDYLGVGLSDRPVDYDYSWSSLGRLVHRVIDKLSIDKFHLVVHDIGGPIGFEVVAAIPERIKSLTALNTLLDVDGFTKPWTMRPFEIAGVGELWVASAIPPIFAELFYVQGVPRSVPRLVSKTHLKLLKGSDGGRAFLKIMRSFEATAEKQSLYRQAISARNFPMQAVWGEGDPALRVETYGEVFREIVGDDRFHTVSGKHFLQETDAAAIAAKIAEQVAQTG